MAEFASNMKSTQTHIDAAVAFAQEGHSVLALDPGAAAELS